MSARKGNDGTFKLYGLPWQIFGVAFIIIMTATYTGALTTDMAGILALCIALGGVLDEFGERLPIWNTYIGGGILMCFIGTAVLKQFYLIPTKYLKAIDWFVSGNVNFLNLFIIFLITGSILSLERKILLRSFAGYIPAILGGVAASMILGVGTGLIFGISPQNCLINYVLPIMGGGNGGGAVPLSQIYEQVTGKPAATYYAFAIIILTIANLMCIVAAALLNNLGMKLPSWTGDKKTLVRGAEFEAGEKEAKVEPTMGDIAGALAVGVGAYVVGRVFSKLILPTIFGAAIHHLAYMIIFVVILSATGVIPANIRAGAKKIQSYMTNYGSPIVMVGMGVDFDLAELLRAASLENVMVALMVVIGAILGSALVGYLVGFYPIDSAITAGLCMANRGGNGDLAVLGASERMDLMAYASLSSRLGGGIILVIGSFMFSFFLK